MRDEEIEAVRNLFDTEKVVSTEMKGSDLLVKFSGGSELWFNWGGGVTHKAVTVSKPNKNHEGAGHLIDPFEMPSIPACLGSGNTCSPDAEEVFPGPGV